MITEQEMMTLRRGDKVLVECTVEAVFVKSGMVMVTTRDCDKGFDAYEDEVMVVTPTRPKGEWIDHPSVADPHKSCPFCKERNNRATNFCPNCGSDLR